jgi:DNA-directed RNA polymerase specialized sigma24 family protein
LAAWRGLEAFEGRASVRAWLYRIATNRCLNALRDRARRPREAPATVRAPEPTRQTEPIWLEPGGSGETASENGVQSDSSSPRASY